MIHVKSNLNRLIKIQRNQGNISALSSIRSYITNQAEASLSGLKTRYWDTIGGTQMLTVGDLAAEFDATTRRGGHRVRWMYDHENNLLNDILTNLNEDDIFFDVGANIGIFSCYAAQVCSRGYTVAFEPYPPNVHQLERNLSYNVNNNCFDVLDVALSDSEGHIDFTSHGHGPGHQTGSISPAGDSIKVRTVSGDELIAKSDVPSPTVVKIDVEGAESLVLDGLENNLSDSSCRLLYCEIHLPAQHRPSIQDYDESKESILRKVSEMGFDIIDEKKRDSDIHIKAKKNSML